jgi:hypothetical protein
VAARLAALLAVALLVVPAAAQATEPASLYDAPGQLHNDVCVRLASGAEPLRFADGTPTGFRLTGDVRMDPDQCPAGRVRLDLHEIIPSLLGPLAFHRGGNGYEDEQNVKYGALAESDLAGDLPTPEPSSGGRGAACTLADEPAYHVRVRAIPKIMKYKRPQDTPLNNNAGASFMHYGDPGADQGDRRDVHYSYLVWSFVDVQGGGMVRTLLAPGQVVRPCDVEPIRMQSYDREGDLNGRVSARYVKTTVGTCPVYGWMAWSHNYYGDGGAAAVDHAEAMSLPPPPDPPADPDCPAAAPATRPTLTYDDPEPAGGGAWQLSGTVNPEGTPAAYRFEYGRDDSYGQSTDTGRLDPLDHAFRVRALATSLRPATTYHYRLVAASTHGVRHGPDRTFTTVAPTSTAAGVQARTAKLGGLTMAPHVVRRARSRRGTTARILFRLSVPATVTLTFVRRVPRHGNRAARWVRSGRNLSATVPAGRSKLAFGGWLGRRALRSGDYRLQAVPTGASGRAGVARHTRFRLR